nr:unnamed protein product [Spirometra erinaceieuropaei]
MQSSHDEAPDGKRDASICLSTYSGLILREKFDLSGHPQTRRNNSTTTSFVASEGSYTVTSAAKLYNTNNDDNQEPYQLTIIATPTASTPTTKTTPIPITNESQPNSLTLRDSDVPTLHRLPTYPPSSPLSSFSPPPPLNIQRAMHARLQPVLIVIISPHQASA